MQFNALTFKVDILWVIFTRATSGRLWVHTFACHTFGPWLYVWLLLRYSFEGKYFQQKRSLYQSYCSTMKRGLQYRYMDKHGGLWHSQGNWYIQFVPLATNSSVIFSACMCTSERSFARRRLVEWLWEGITLFRISTQKIFHYIRYCIWVHLNMLFLLNYTLLHLFLFPSGETRGWRVIIYYRFDG